LAMTFSTAISSATPGALTGQKALVTGASKGIGRGIALALARAGADVVVNYNSDCTGAENVVREIEALGRKAVAVHASVGKSVDVNRMFDEILPHFSPLTILVNNAGVQTWKPLLELTEDEWDHVLDTNLKGCFLCTQRAGAHMRDHGLGGSIINIGSGCNKVAFPNLVNYTTSKGGIEMFTKSAAVELGRYKIRVNCAAPGAIEVERTKNEGGDYASIWSKAAPMGRIGTPEDVGEFVVFLASPAAEFISGQTLWIDGGVFSKAYWPYEM
jgi:NAD(P)-dependent dehydrogenase (short-subunit alcohol dehydrogenase family)